MRRGLLIAMVISLVLYSCGTTGKEITEVNEPVTKEIVNMYISEKETIHSAQEGVLWLDAQVVGDTIYYLADEIKKSSTGTSVFKKAADGDPVKIVNWGSRSVEEFAVDLAGNIYALSYEGNAYYWRKYNCQYASRYSNYTNNGIGKLFRDYLRNYLTENKYNDSDKYSCYCRCKCDVILEQIHYNKRRTR